MSNLDKLAAQLKKSSKKAAAKKPVSKADDFVAKGSDRTRPKDSPMRRGEGGKRVVIYLPDEQAKALKLHAVERECSISHAVSEALYLYLSGERISKSLDNLERAQDALARAQRQKKSGRA